MSSWSGNGGQKAEAEAEAETETEIRPNKIAVENMKRQQIHTDSASFHEISSLVLGKIRSNIYLGSWVALLIRVSPQLAEKARRQSDGSRISTQPELVDHSLPASAYLLLLLNMGSLIPKLVPPASERLSQ